MRRYARAIITPCLPKIALAEASAELQGPGAAGDEISRRYRQRHLHPRDKIRRPGHHSGHAHSAGPPLGGLRLYTSPRRIRMQGAAVHVDGPTGIIGQTAHTIESTIPEILCHINLLPIVSGNHSDVWQHAMEACDGGRGRSARGGSAVLPQGSYEQHSHAHPMYKLRSIHFTNPLQMSSRRACGHFRSPCFARRSIICSKAPRRASKTAFWDFIAEISASFRSIAFACCTV